MLTAKQRRFCEEYVIDLNGAQAAVRTGYSSKTARITASKLLTNPNIQDYIQELREELSKRNEITADKVLAELVKIGFSDITNYLEVRGTRNNRTVEIYKTSDLTDDQKGAISEIRQTKDGISLKLHNKTEALHKIGIHLGMFTDRLQMLDKNGQPTDPDSHDPLAPVALTVNVIERNADIQQATEQSTVQPEADNA